MPDWTAPNRSAGHSKRITQNKRRGWILKLYNIKDPEGIILRDYLARDRTELAAERTFLSYIRTAIGVFSAGAGCVKLINDSHILYYVGYLFLVASPVIAILGFVRNYQLKKKIRSIPDNHLLIDEEELIEAERAEAEAEDRD
ncbi:MAG: DUF202 domain-containing protein [Firmicutes bacterium]|nr:DUF202 domain-containing protein [Bacillota bacterium]